MRTLYRLADRGVFNTDDFPWEGNRKPNGMAEKRGKQAFRRDLRERFDIYPDCDTKNIITILDGRTQAVIRNHFLRYPRQISNRVKLITMDMFIPYYKLARQLFPNAQIVLDRIHIVQHLGRAMNRVRTQIMNVFDRKSHEYRALKRYWKLIQQDSRKLSDKRFYRPTFRMHLTNKEVFDRRLNRGKLGRCQSYLCLSKMF